VALTLSLCVLYGSHNKQRLLPNTTLADWFLYNRDGKCLQRGTDWVFKYSGLRLVFKGLVVYKHIDTVYYMCFNILKLTSHVMHHQFNIQQLYALPTLYLCVLYLSVNKQRLVPLTA